MSELQKFAPAETSGKQVIFNESLLPVVARIAEFLSSEKVWEFFSSTAEQTGGVIHFPYLRANAMLQSIQNNLTLIQNADAHATDNIQKYYQRMSECAMRALLWVDVGFEGIEHLAISPASRNWESIETHGKQQYEQSLKIFANFRKTYLGKDTDCFSKYGLEYLLDRWQEK